MACASSFVIHGENYIRWMEKKFTKKKKIQSWNTSSGSMFTLTIFCTIFWRISHKINTDGFFFGDGNFSFFPCHTNCLSIRIWMSMVKEGQNLSALRNARFRYFGSILWKKRLVRSIGYSLKLRRMMFFPYLLPFWQNPVCHQIW